MLFDFRIFDRRLRYLVIKDRSLDTFDVLSCHEELLLLEKFVFFNLVWQFGFSEHFVHLGNQIATSCLKGLKQN